MVLINLPSSITLMHYLNCLVPIYDCMNSHIQKLEEYELIGKEYNKSYNKK